MHIIIDRLLHLYIQYSVHGCSFFLSFVKHSCTYPHLFLHLEIISSQLHTYVCNGVLVVHVRDKFRASKYQISNIHR